MNKKILVGALMLTSLIASPVFAETTGTSTSSYTPRARVAVDYACVQTAVDAREGAVADAFVAFSAAENAGLTTRKAALHDAWGLSTNKERNTAVKKAWGDFNAANRTAYKALRAGHKSAWSAFAVASKACHAPVAESHGEEGIGSLGL